MPATPDGAPAEGTGEAAAAADAAAAVAAGRRLFLGDCSFRTSAPTIASLPAVDLPEIAFCGRSNVGKSSLLNALVGRKGIARVSVTPGRTQALNFFDLGRRLTLVDLPGYGYAQAPKETVADWTDTVFAYLKGRPNLARACLLIDGRHGFIKTDRAAMTVLDKSAVIYQVVLTKADKLRPSERAKILAAVTAEAATHVAAHPDVLFTSSEDGSGIDALRAALVPLALAG